MKRYLLTITIFLSVAGPSIITTMAGNDGGGVATYSLVGATFGYGLLFLLPFLTLMYAITQEVGSRLAIVTGRGLADLIRERMGLKAALLIFSLFLIANIGTLITNLAAIKASLDMLSLPPAIGLIFIVIILFGIVTRLGCATSQKRFLIGTLLYIAYAISAFRSDPDWALAVKSLVVPDVSSFSPALIIAALAFIGTTITPWGQFFIQSYMKDKKVSTDRLPYARAEAYIGAIVSNLITFFIVVATTATLYNHHVHLDSGEAAARAIEPFAGHLAGALFAVGLLNAGIIGLIVVGISTSYAFTEFFGFEGTLDATYSRGKNFYLVFIIQLVVALIIVLLPFISLFRVTIITQMVNGMLLPVIFYLLLRFARDRTLMREHTISRFYAILLQGSGIVIAAASLFTIIYSLFFT